MSFIFNEKMELNNKYIKLKIHYNLKDQFFKSYFILYPVSKNVYK